MESIKIQLEEDAEEKFVLPNINTKLTKEAIEKFYYMGKELQTVTAFKCDFVPFSSNIPVYEELNEKQQAWYLFWRMNVSQNIFLKTDTSYILLYIYEKINQIGVKNQTDGLGKIVKIIKAYYKQHPKLADKAYNIIRDYMLYFDKLEFIYTKYIRDIFEKESCHYLSDENMGAFFENGIYIDLETVMEYSNYIIPEELIDTPDKKDAVEGAIYTTLLKINEYYKKNNTTILDKYIPTTKFKEVKLFNNIPFYREVYKPKQIGYKISDKMIYSIKDGMCISNYNKLFPWSKEKKFREFISNTLQLISENILYISNEIEDIDVNSFFNEEIKEIIEEVVNSDDNIIETFSCYDDDMDFVEEFDYNSLNIFENMAAEAFYNKAKEYENVKVNSANAVRRTGQNYYNNYFFGYANVEYSNLTKAQLNWYFKWRESARVGTYLDADLDYIALYINEIINLIGIETPKDGFEILIELLSAYQNDGIRTIINFQLLLDYIVYYNLDKSYLQKLYELPFNNYYEETIKSVINFTTLFSKKSKTIELSQIAQNELLQTCSKLASYNVAESKFVLDGYGELLKKVIFESFMNIDARFRDEGKKGFLDSYKVRTSKIEWSPFRNFRYFYKKEDTKKQEYIINDYIKFTKVDGKWYNTLTVQIENLEHYQFQDMLTRLIRNMENELRIALNYKRKLKIDSWFKYQEKTIQETIKKLLYKNQIEQDKNGQYYFKEKPKFEVDITKLDKLKKEANEIRDRIIKEQAEANTGATKASPATMDINLSNNKMVQEAKGIEPYGSNNPFQNFISALNETQKEVIHLILQENVKNKNEAIKEIAKKSNIMVETLIDFINELATKYIKDSLINTDSGTPEIYEDYVDEIKKVL
ncbi:MAG: TerB N-terminal domain-containing protein [Oscillospiraceae bacterium]|nr:TerB N-terminal domain-containing protein [Oscillospiraceae bacterium]